MPPTARDPLHALVYGDSGAGKSTFAATWPTPMHVFMFDPIGKETPYLRRGTPGDLQALDDGSLTRSVFDRKTGEEIIRMMHFLDPEPTAPSAYANFLAYMASWRRDYAGWATAVIDSVTFMELAARKYNQYILNPRSKEPRQWFAGSTDALEEMLMMSFGSLPINVVLVAHVDEDKDELHGTFVRNPKAPGRVRKGLGAAYSELYRAYVTTGEQGERLYQLQTQSDRLYNASSQIGAPDPAFPHYNALWPPVAK